MGLCLLMKFCLLFLSFVLKTSANIYGTTDVFYSQLWTLGDVTPSSPSTFSTTTATVQDNIVRANIALAQISRIQDEYHKWTATLNAPGTSTSTFTISLTVTWPPSGMRLKWINDLIIDNNGGGDRTVSTTFDLTTTTIFTTVPSGIASFPLTKTFTILPTGNYDGSKYIEYSSATSISGNILTFSVTANDKTKLSIWTGLAVIYSAANVNTDKIANSWNISIYQNNFNDPDNYNMKTSGSTFGPNFNTKCLYGYSKITYKGDKAMDWKFTLSSFGNFYFVDYPNDDNDFNPAGTFFCFGNNTNTCGEAETMYDNISLTCYAPTQCPLVEFSTWTSTAFCPICAQLICLNCTVANRSSCLSCGINSTIVGGLCVCNADSWEWTTFISTAALGKWSNTVNSLTECRYNCTAQIAGCGFPNCTSSTFCTQCISGFYLNLITAFTDQNCLSCSLAIANCTQCTSATTCTLCQIGYYIKGGLCTQCRSVMTNCATCTVGTACTLCDYGYPNISLSVCQCSPTVNNLTNCATCTVATACTFCVNTTFYISLVDSLCHSCRKFDAYCMTCTALQVCTSCDVGYTVNVSGTLAACISCTTISQCILCSSPLVCTTCVSGYIPQSGVCTTCNTIMNFCATCTDPVTCTLCEFGYVPFNASVCQCSPTVNNMTNCILCAVKTACTQCVNGTFFISAVDSMCHSCKEFDIHCITCTSYQVCLTCDPGYTVVSGTTSLCVACWVLFPNCTLCSSPLACDVCNYTYGLTTASTCQTCDTLHQKGCQACTSYAACELCVNQTYLVGRVCLECWVIDKCVTCFVNTGGLLQCLTCLPGNFLTLSNLTGQPICLHCMHFTTFCVTCTNLTCLNCTYPYLPGPDGLCSTCVDGFYYVSKICTNIAGCISAVYLPNGATTCIACDSDLFYTFDVRTQKCVCKQGYYDYKSTGPLPECHPLCGDGLIIWSSEQCDDQNLFINDGCDKFCREQPGFDCGVLEPSQCILILNVKNFVFNYVYRILGENKGVMSYTIEPGHPGLTRRPWDKMIRFNFPTTAVNQSQLSYVYDYKTGQLLITVPYNQQLQDSTLQAELTLDPSYIRSETPFLTLVHKLNGINAKLIFQKQQELDTYKNIELITLILTVILLLLFYLGSYAHKMIGLETIQVIQAIYFVRMIAPSSSSSLLASMNSIQYSTTGYQNAEAFFGNVQSIETKLNEETTTQFIAINLNKFLLLNVNFSLIPIGLAILAYAYTLIRKFRSRNEYFKVKEQDQKDIFTKFQRSSQWVYDHFVFPYIMMFNLLSFFQCVSLLSKPYSTESEDVKKLEAESFLVHVVLVLCTTAIYCYEISNSTQQFAKYKMSEHQKTRVPKSTIQKLEHDENNTDRPNYHPVYVLVHLVYYLLMSILMIVSVLIPTFKNSLDLVMGAAVVYFVLIWFWNPYHEMVRLHNNFLKFYYGTYVAVLVICYLFVNMPKSNPDVYKAFIYVIVMLISAIIISGFIRIAIEIRFRKALEHNNDLMRWDEDDDLLENKRKNSDDDPLTRNINRSQLNKRQQLVEKNSYTLNTQLNQMNKQLQAELDNQEKLKLAQQGKSYLMNKIREDISKKKLNSIIEDFSNVAFKNGAREKKFFVKLDYVNDMMEPEKEEQVGLNLNIPSFGQQQKLIESPKTKKPLVGEQKSGLDLLKQKLRSQWVYMHDE